MLLAESPVSVWRAFFCIKQTVACELEKCGLFDIAHGKLIAIMYARMSFCAARGTKERDIERGRESEQ